MNDSELINQLQQASEGLLWMSEADYPFEAFVWEETTVTSELLLRRTGHSPDIPVETVGVDKFFCHCTTEQDWHNEEEKAEVKRYLALVETLKKHLKDIQVYRLGQVEVDIYIIGTTASGHLAGLSTKNDTGFVRYLRSLI